jgi:hypothetical protein
LSRATSRSTTTSFNTATSRTTTFETSKDTLYVNNTETQYIQTLSRATSRSTVTSFNTTFNTATVFETSKDTLYTKNTETQYIQTLSRITDRSTATSRNTVTSFNTNTVFVTNRNTTTVYNTAKLTATSRDTTTTYTTQSVFNTTFNTLTTFDTTTYFNTSRNTQTSSTYQVITDYSRATDRVTIVTSFNTSFPVVDTTFTRSVARSFYNDYPKFFRPVDYAAVDSFAQDVSVTGYGVSQRSKYQWNQTTYGGSGVSIQYSDSHHRVNWKNNSYTIYLQINDTSLNSAVALYQASSQTGPWTSIYVANSVTGGVASGTIDKTNGEFLKAELVVNDGAENTEYTRTISLWTNEYD